MKPILFVPGRIDISQTDMKIYENENIFWREFEVSIKTHRYQKKEVYVTRLVLPPGPPH